MSVTLEGAETLASDDIGVRVVRGGLQRSLGFLLTNVLSLVSAVVLLRYLGVADFGRYGTVMAVVSLAYGISDAGLTTTGSRELAVRRDRGARREVLAHLLALRLALTLAGMVVAVAFTFLAGYESPLVLGVALAGSGIVLSSVQAAMLLPLYVDLRNARVAFNEVLQQALLLAAFATLAVVGAGLVPFFAAHIAVGAALLLVAPFLIGRASLVRPRWGSRRQMRALIQVAVPIAVANVLGVLYVRLLVILMSLLSDSPTEVGYYVTSTRVVELLGGLPYLLGTVILPVLTVAARDDHERMRYMSVRMTETMALGGVLVALFVWFAAEPIVLALGGDAYSGAVPVLRIQCLAVATLFVAASWNQTLIGMGRLRALMAIVGAGLAAVVVAGVVLIPAFDARGAAAAAVAADAVLCLTSYVALRRAGPGRDVPRATLVRIGLAAVPAAGVGLIGGVPDLVSAVAASLTFIVAALVLRTVPPELTHAVRGLRRYLP